MKILVIDDDQSWLNTLQMTLGKSWDLVLTSHISEAKRLATDFDVKIVLVDYQLGIHDGIELASTFKALRQDLKIILVSGFLDKKSVIHALRAKVDDVLEKPVAYATLLKTLEKYRRDEPADYRVCYREKQFVFKDQTFALTSTECRILEALLKTPGHPIDKTALQNLAIGQKTSSRNLLDTHIYNIRKKVPPLRELLLSTAQGLEIRLPTL